MEAAVLNPAIMTELDCNSNTLNAELEVKKLQELVRKLERQNEQLRTRASGCSGGPHVLPPSPACALGSAGGYCLPSPVPTLLCQSSLGSFLPPEEPFEYFHPHTAGGGAAAAGEAEDAFELSVLDELELLDLDSLCCSDESEETWLYVSSKAAEFTENFLTPLQWCRQVLDCPKSEVEAARRSLSLRLEQGRSLMRSALSPQSSLDSDFGASEVEDDSITLGYKLQDLTDVQVMARLQEESLRQDYASTSSILANRRSQSFTFQLSQLSAGPDLEEEEEEEDDEDYGLLPPPQPRLTRLPHSHTFSSIRDWRRSTCSLSTPPSTPSTPPYPSAGFAFQAQPQTQPLGLGLGLGLGSLCASEQQGFRPGSAEFENKLRRSMPNLVRAPSMPSVPTPTNPSASPSLLRNSQSFDSSSGLARLQSSIPSPGQLQNRVQSVGNFSALSRQPLKATAYVSPTIKGSVSMPTSVSLQSLNCSGGSNGGVGSGIPLLSKPASGGGTPTSTPSTPRSSLPRPASFVATTSSVPRGKVAQPTRSLLTPPKSLSTLSALRDSTWRDGCY
ncbi:SLAIN motif-containing protein 1-like isoform X4 [Seriola lalandi dorsalis]|uniref:SLAIN motif-containing protein 1-like isoform X4 n=1 Tax=Seriola lalandi dorsalis TaxID=1841481 RepID=UPI000C6F4A6C|nr:SLAIN motif-containing protein 1-like isoform X4 [Seriola lalandi dorsalis]